ncbi:hypothetical protein [Piscibacillus salipiscarius]|uniref:Two-component signal transduction system YycFG, regulatory protein YycI n=1 Tax=Piscibacillus salipiscarius TaxID=299480 RepID=A0ABW5Q816_9BACI|nr:hypothetical protein [Piscibacillus salipiscarius]
MNRHQKITYSVLGLIILLNIFFFIRLELKLSESHNQIEQNVINSIRSVDSSVSSINHEIHNMKENSEWITDTQYDVNLEKSNASLVAVNINWSFKEIENKAKISVVYRERDKNWQKVTAEKSEGNNFVASIKAQPFKEYEYQILSEGDVNRTSNIQPLPPDLHTPAHLEIRDRHQGDNFTILGFDHIDERDLPFFKIKKITAIYQYVDGKKESKEITKGDLPSVIENQEHQTVNDPNLYYVVVEPADQVLSVDLKVEYANGYAHEGTVYPETIDFYQSIYKEK